MDATKTKPFNIEKKLVYDAYMEPIPRRLCNRYGITSTPHWSRGSCESTSAIGARRYRLVD
jgi:hypothetical protein